MLFAKYLNSLKENEDDFHSIVDEEQEQTIINFIMNLPEEALTDEQEEKRDKIIDLCYEIFEDLSSDNLDGDNLEIYGALTNEIFPDDSDDSEEVDESEEISEKIFLNRMSRAEKRKNKKYRRVNKVKLRRQREIWKRKNKAKLKRATKTGIGLSGKRRGLHVRRKAI